MDTFPKDLDFDVAFFIDFTKSNLWQDKHGLKTQQSRYEQTIRNFYPFLQHCKKEQIYYCYRFGDKTTRDQRVLPLNDGMTKPQPSQQPPRELQEDEYFGLDHLLQGYNVARQVLQLSGPSCLCQSVEQACKLQKNDKPLISLYISDTDFIFQLYDFQSIIIAIDINDEINETTQAYDRMVGRKFDNVNYFNINEVGMLQFNKAEQMSLKAFMEVPDQFGAMCKLGYLGERGKQIIETVEHQMNNKNQQQDIQEDIV